MSDENIRLDYIPKLSDQDIEERSPSKIHPAKDRHSSFGWGRRICPGAGLAQNSLFIAIARLLWTFEFLPATEPDGSERQYDTFAYTQGFNIRPQSFPCEIRIRGEKHREVLNKDLRLSIDIMKRFAPFEE